MEAVKHSSIYIPVSRLKFNVIDLVNIVLKFGIVNLKRPF